MRTKTQTPALESIRTPRTAYDALVAEMSHDSGFNQLQIGLEGLIPIYQTPERITYSN